MQIFLIIIAVLLALLLQYLLSRNAAQGITAQIEPDTDAAEPDERFRLILRVRNNSRLIRPFVRYKIMLPEEMHIHSRQKAVRIPPHLVQVSGTMFLWPKKGCEQIIEVSVSVRGAYRFGNIRIETGDFLGLKEEGREIPGFRSVAIYPKQADSPGIEHTIGSIMGDYSVRRYIFEDPVITAGFREYTGREPFRDISWTSLFLRRAAERNTSGKQIP